MTRPLHTPSTPAPAARTVVRWQIVELTAAAVLVAVFAALIP
jgi:hypothetical protein